MMADARGLSIVIPIYNEREALPRMEARLTKLRDDAPFPVEFLLVNDGSDDGSAEILARMDPRIATVLAHPKNMGYGAALKTGIRKASHDWICISDADETYPDEHIAALFSRAIETKADMVVGARAGGSVAIPWARRQAKRALGALANALTGLSIPDLNSGLRVMPAQRVKSYFNLLPDGFSFTATLTLAMLSDGFAVEFLPINYRPRLGKSKFRPFYDTLNYTQLICRAALWFRPMRVFFPLAALLVLAAFALLFVSWEVTGRPMDVSFGVLLISAVMMFVAGMLADLINRRKGP